MGIQNKIRGFKEIWQFDNRWQLIMSRILFSKENVFIYRYRGMEILVDQSAGDANGAREVLASNMYRQFFPLMGLADGLNVIDVGSNNGGFPLLLKAEGFSIKSLVCVELNPHTYTRLRFNIDRNFACDKTILNAAVCGRDGTITVRMDSGSAGDSIYGNGRAGDTINVKGITLNELFSKRVGGTVVDVCKMDIEGAEFEVFSTGQDTMLEHCRYLLIEIHHDNEHPRITVERRLSSLGFREIGRSDGREQDHLVHCFANSRYI